MPQSSMLASSGSLLPFFVLFHLVQGFGRFEHRLFQRFLQQILLGLLDNLEAGYHPAIAGKAEAEKSDACHNKYVSCGNVEHMPEELYEGKSGDDERQARAAVGEERAFVGEYGSVQREPIAQNEFVPLETVVGVFIHSGVPGKTQKAGHEERRGPPVIRMS